MNRAAEQEAGGPVRLDHVDVIKGIAILLIIQFHILGKVFGGEPALLRKVSFQGVTAFFVVSGFTLYASYAARREHGFSWREWFTKRLLRVVPLYWVILTGTAILIQGKSAVADPGEVPALLWDLLAHGLFLHVYSPEYYWSINPVFWFVGVLVQLYLLFPLLAAGVRRIPSALLTLLLGAVMVGVTVFWAGPYLKFMYFGTTAAALVAFLLGMTMARAAAEGCWPPHRAVRWGLGVVSVVGIVCYLEFVGQFPGRWSWLAWTAFGLCCYGMIHLMSVAIVNASQASPIVGGANRVLKYLGEISYAIFLLHWVLVAVLIPKGSVNPLWYAVYFAVVIAVSQVATNFDYRHLQPFFSRMVGPKREPVS